jgi:hypothetical protein
MTSSVVLPEPHSLDKISILYSRNRLMDRAKHWLANAPYATDLIKRVVEGKIVKFETKEYDQLSLHLLYRSMHQTNEACNKVWSTGELYYHAKSCGLLCHDYSTGFLGSSTVPTLHYANISALISIMSLFGLGSWINREKGMEFFNIVRTSTQIQMYKREEYLKALLGKAPKGWHRQVLETYRGLQSFGIDLPAVDLAASRKLLLARSKYHYDVLGHTTMIEVYGVDEYFQLLPVVLDTIGKAIAALHEVLRPIPNGCDDRFEAFCKQIPALAGSYEKKIEVPTSNLM